jgi:phospholipase C
MAGYKRRDFLRAAARGGAGIALASLPPVIQRALAAPPAVETGTIQDVKHVVVLMLENRSFDHYFGTLRGVRGFGDRRTIPLASGKPVWHQSDGSRSITPFRLDTRKTNGIRVPVTPHSFADSQAAWGQGRLSEWPRFKTPYSMGHYTREDIPFQFALAEAFTLCDAYFCTVTSGTGPNRIALMSGTNFDPALRARGVNNTAATSEPDNVRCWIEGRWPEPGYKYQGEPFRWPTIPEVLERAGVSWRIYQDPNDNWDGGMHGGLAIESFRTARAGSPIYRNGMSHWSLEKLTEHVREGSLPQVSWILPPRDWSEHPEPSSPLQGAEYTARVLEALTANEKTWSRTVLLLMFDENDGLFDHVPPPAPPSIDADGKMAGKSTLDLGGEYFRDPARKNLDPRDTVSGGVRPWGLGPRVPMYVISPWSKGGWVCSEVFDHTSVGRFLEKRFAIEIAAISPWHRAVCGDLTSAFDFAHPSGAFPRLPRTQGSNALVAQHEKRPKAEPPPREHTPSQEPGRRPSRPLPYRLDVQATVAKTAITLRFSNEGQAGAVFHVYDRRHLDRIPRRYTVEAGKSLDDQWPAVPAYDLAVFGPNGFLRELKGRAGVDVAVRLEFLPQRVALQVVREGKTKLVSLAASQGWYDFTERGESFEWRFAGRMETGRPGISDPALG